MSTNSRNSKIEGDTKQAQTVLGRKIEAPKEYDPSILVKVNRQDNRTRYGISGNNLPFVGFDVWNAYEVSFLTKNGLPVCLVGKIIYPVTSPYIVESKSLKLYLNSFNMTRSEYEDVRLCTKHVKDTVSSDLSKLLETDVVVQFFSYAQNVKIFKNYELLEKSISCLESVKFDYFQEVPEVLYGTPSKFNICLRSSCNLLRSRCKITHQPDWGTLFVEIKSKFEICKTSLLKYIISFRNENHFHEEVVEMIFKRLLDAFTPLNLMVGAVYTRRGGIDICPIRATDSSLLELNLVNPLVHCEKLLKQ